MKTATALQLYSVGLIAAVFLAAIVAGVAITSTQLLVIAGATLAFVLAASRAAAWYAERSLGQLRLVTESLARGEDERRLPLNHRGELGRLTAAIRRLAEEMRSRTAAGAAEAAFLRTVIDSLAEGVLVVDARQQIVRINEASRHMLGIQVPVPFSTDHLPRELRAPLRAALRGNTVTGLEIVIAPRFLSISARSLPTGGAVLAAYDITALRRLENVRRDFVANVSHELRTPLSVIAGYSETLADPTIPSADKERFAHTIGAHAHRMQQLVTDLLDLARLDTGGWVPNPVQLQLRELMEEVRQSCPPKDDAVTVTVSVESQAEHVTADRTAVKQIIENLLTNALRYTPVGTVQIFGVREDSGVRIGVRDTGSGIPAEHLPRIFERFYRADANRSRDSGGTGLGLSIVKHLAESHGGRADAQSEVGKGTTVSVWLPQP